MTLVAQLLIVLHIVALVAGGSNGVMQMLTGPRLAAASPEMRTVIFALQDTTAKVGKISMALMILTGLAVFGIKWGFVPPNAWFWVKMAALAVMLVTIFLGERQGHKARAGGEDAAGAAARARQLGQVTTLAAIVVVLAPVMTFA